MAVQQGWLLVDGHCDSLCDMADGKRDLRERGVQGHIDTPRLREAGVDVQVMALWADNRFVPGGAMRRTMALMDAAYRLSESRQATQVTSVQEIEDLARSGLVSLVLAIEGAEALEGSIEALRVFHRLGVRMMTLAWNRRNEVADGVLETDSGGGLTRFGRQVVAEMGGLGMVIDVSHLAAAGLRDVLGRCQGPIVASHSNAHRLCPHPRNLTDDQVRAIAGTGGLVGVCFYAPFVDADRFKRSLARVADHVEYLMELVGPEHVALGSDFDGDVDMVEGLEDVTRLPALLDELLQRGVPPGAVQAFAGGNWMRVFGRVWK